MRRSSSLNILVFSGQVGNSQREAMPTTVVIRPLERNSGQSYARFIAYLV